MFPSFLDLSSRHIEVNSLSVGSDGWAESSLPILRALSAIGRRGTRSPALDLAGFARIERCWLMTETAHALSHVEHGQLPLPPLLF